MWSLSVSIVCFNFLLVWYITDDGEIIHIPSYVIRGAGSSTHYEYEVRVNAGGERWTLLRRYRRFRELHLQMREKYGSVVSIYP